MIVRRQRYEHVKLSRDYTLCINFLVTDFEFSSTTWFSNQSLLVNSHNVLELLVFFMKTFIQENDNEK